MSNIVKRLRGSLIYFTKVEVDTLIKEAADRIEELENYVEEIRQEGMDRNLLE